MWEIRFRGVLGEVVGIGSILILTALSVRDIGMVLGDFVAVGIEESWHYSRAFSIVAQVSS
jgi:hypothetical protein